MSYNGYHRDDEPDRLRLSDKEASDRFFKKASIALSGVLGFATIETLATFFVINNASPLVILPIMLTGIASFGVSIVWLFNKPKHTAYHLSALDAGRVVDLRRRLKHDLSKKMLRDWLKEDYPIRTWDMHQLLNWDAKLQLGAIQ